MAAVKKTKKAPAIKVAVTKRRLKKAVPIRKTVPAKPAKKTAQKIETPAYHPPPGEVLYKTRRQDLLVQLVWRRHSFSLKPGSWKRCLTEAEFKILIAEALNACVYYGYKEDDPGTAVNFLCRYADRLHIAGYYITDEQVNLVWDIVDIDDFTWYSSRGGNGSSEARFLHMLNRFYDTVRSGLINLIRHTGRPRSASEIGLEKEGSAYTAGDLFTRRKITDEYLVGLITGLPPAEPSSHDRRLAKLKERLHAAEFCSLIDYQGGIGPVVISREVEDYLSHIHEKISKHKSHENIRQNCI